jgi:hypothetical protein
MGIIGYASSILAHITAINTLLQDLILSPSMAINILSSVDKSDLRTTSASRPVF